MELIEQHVASWEAVRFPDEHTDARCYRWCCSDGSVQRELVMHVTCSNENIPAGDLLVSAQQHAKLAVCHQHKPGGGKPVQGRMNMLFDTTDVREIAQNTLEADFSVQLVPRPRRGCDQTALPGASQGTWPLHQRSASSQLKSYLSISLYAR